MRYHPVVYEELDAQGSVTLLLYVRVVAKMEPTFRVLRGQINGLGRDRL